jgi:hypothetical protein
MKLPICTVGYILRGEGKDAEVWLGEKAATPKAVKRKIAGKLIGFGGDVMDSDESIKHSFSRELSEESGFQVLPKDVEIAARTLIRDESGDRLTLYWVMARIWSGTAGTSREMVRGAWYPLLSLPENILAADKIILPRIFRGERLAGFFEYDADMNVVRSELEPCSEF